jgi:hypothetical protein
VEKEREEIPVSADTPNRIRAKEMLLIIGKNEEKQKEEEPSNKHVGEEPGLWGVEIKKSTSPSILEKR